MARKGDDLRSQAWKKARAKALANATTCTLCGQPIDHDAPARSRWSASVDHVVPRSLGGSLLDPANLRPVHYGCNSRRGNGVTRGKGTRSKTRKSVTSRDW